MRAIARCNTVDEHQLARCSLMSISRHPASSAWVAPIAPTLLPRRPSPSARTLLEGYLFFQVIAYWWTDPVDSGA
jgi:hypothetical protein